MVRSAIVELSVRLAFILRLGAIGFTASRALMSISNSLPSLAMLATMVDINGNVDYSVHSRPQQPQPQTTVQPPPQPPKPSIPLEEQINDAFFEWGLVEVLITREDAQVWHDAYVIDVEKVAVEASKEGEKGGGGNITAHTCTIALAVDGEDPLTTLTKPKHIQKCLLEQVRLKLKFDAETQFAENDMVHVMMETAKPFICWQPRKVKMAKDNFFVVEMVNSSSEDLPAANGASSLDIVPKESLRPFSSSHQLTEENNPFYRFTLPLSQDLVQFVHADFQWLANYNLHKDFKKYSQLISVFFDCEKKSLICLAFANQKFVKDQALKRAQMLTSMHFNKLKESYVLSSRMDTIKGHPGANTQSSNRPAEFVLSLAIKKKYTGLAIGKSGANIQKARKMLGIHSLDLDDINSTFIIRGVSQEACQGAADVLNYGDETVKYPRDYGELFRDRKLIEEIVAKSGVVKVELFNDIETDDEIELLIIGKPDAVENFKIILDFQKAEFYEIYNLKCQHKILLQEIFNQQRTSSPLTNMVNNFVIPRNFAEAVKSGIKN